MGTSRKKNGKIRSHENRNEKKSSANEMIYSSATNKNSDILHFLHKTTVKRINET